MSWEEQMRKASKAFFEQRRQREAVATHCDQAIEQATADGGVNADFIDCLLSLANELCWSHDWEAAQVLLSRVVPLATDALGVADNLTGQAFEMLSCALVHTRQDQEAVDVMLTSVQGAKNAYPPVFDEVVGRIRKLAICYHQLGRLDEAKQVLSEAIEMVPDGHVDLDAMRTELRSFDKPYYTYRSAKDEPTVSDAAC